LKITEFHLLLFVTEHNGLETGSVFHHSQLKISGSTYPSGHKETAGLNLQTTYVRQLQALDSTDKHSFYVLHTIVMNV